MARLLGACSVTSTALVAATAQTLIQMAAPTNQRCAIYEYEISFDGTNSANTPANVLITRQSNAGTFTNTTVAPVKINDPSGTLETLQLNYQTVATVEPTIAGGSTLKNYFLPVFGGSQSLQFAPWTSELTIMGGTRVGFKLTAAQNVNASMTASYEE